MNSYAKTFGGGVFCYTQRGYVHQTYTFANITFTNNTSPHNGGLAFVNLANRPVKSVITGLIYNCTFANNTATPGVAGAAGVYPLYALANNKVVFKDCKFYDNSALMNYGGAVDITSYNFLDNRLATFPVEFINWLVVETIAFVMYYCNYNYFYSVFDGNHASDGAAMNLAYYSAKFDNVTFRNSTESAIRVSFY